MPFPGGNTAARWREPEWLAASDSWIASHVDVVGTIEERRAEGWSVVRKVPTPAGTVWFKACAPEHAYEVPLVERLADRDCVPRVIASDRERGWLLVEDAGVALRHYLDGVDYLTRWRRAVARYARLQIEATDLVHAMLADGVVDRRPRTLAGAFAAVLEDRALLQPDTENALTDHELERGHAALPGIEALADEIVALGVPDTIEHNDLHDGNILVDGDDLRIIDWGDAGVSHPFCSLALTVHVLTHVLKAEAEDPRVAGVLDAYLEPWEERHGRDAVRTSLDRALVLGDVAGALKWHYVISSLAPDERQDFREDMPRIVRRVLAHL